MTANFRIHGFMKAIRRKGNFTHNNLSRFIVQLSSSCFSNYHSKSSSSCEHPIYDVIKEFDNMIETRPLPPVEEFNIILHNLLAAEKTYDSCTLVLERFKRMCAVGIPVNSSTADSVIRCYCQLQQTKLSFTVLGCCFKLGIVPTDVSLYNMILDRFISQDRTHEAERLFKNMFIFNNINKNNDESADQLLLCELDIVTYNTMLKGLCKVGNNFTAIALLRLMDGRGCKPDIVSYNTVIDGLCRDPGVVNTIDNALKVFNEMFIIKGIPPDGNTYKSLIFAFTKLGRWDELHKMVKQMEDESICLDMQLLNIIVGELSKQDNFIEATNVIICMWESKKFQPDLITYKWLIHVLSSDGQMSLAWKQYRFLKRKGMKNMGMKPDNVTYNTLLDGFIKHMKEDVAMNIFSFMPKEYMNKVAHYLLTRLITRTKPDNYQSEEEYNRDIKCIYLYHLYMHGNSYENALDLFYFMEDRHDELNSNIEVYNILIFGANKCGRFDIARQFFHELSVKGLEPDDVTYTLIIRGFCREGMVKNAKRMFNRMKRSGFLSDSVVDVNQIPLCYLEEDAFSRVACLYADMSGVGYGSRPPPLVATLLRLNLTEHAVYKATNSYPFVPS
ncbi:pentatricopeptide repeat-containing protein DOT4, chloroplastic-like [Rutidosis leptorrhynchoides]|uniref:pentatricopeptide repeat-containing protein DOT4, chloroplastic-like n=1 Tax=Rutidosis leptorrhynchoides TaxID=125765 RepID=UPI003A99B6C8